MFAKYTLFLLVVALVEARFGQEQGNGAIQAISALGDLGKPGEADTIAGGSIKLLLAAANPCAKLVQADKIVETFGTDDRVIAAARGFAAAEQNFSPFKTNVPSICAEPDLPKTEALRGVVPLIDPDVLPKDIENTNSKASLQKPFDAAGKSVAEVMAANGFTNFTAVKLDGTKVNLTGGAAGGGAGEEKKDNKDAAGDKKEGANAAGAEEGQKKEAGAGAGTGAGGADGGNKDNKKAGGANEKAEGKSEDDKKAGAASEKAGGEDED